MLEAMLSEKLLLLFGVGIGAITLFFNNIKKSKENSRIRTRLLDRFKRGEVNYEEYSKISTEEIIDEILSKQDNLVKDSIKNLDEANKNFTKLNKEYIDLKLFNKNILSGTRKFLSDIGCDTDEEIDLKTISDLERILKSAISRNEKINGKLNSYQEELVKKSSLLENNKAKRLENLATIRAKNITLTNRLNTFDKTFEKHNSSLVSTVNKLDDNTEQCDDNSKEVIAKKIKYLHSLKNVKEELKKSLELIGALTHADKETEKLNKSINSIEDRFLNEDSEEINKEQLKVILDEFRKGVNKIKSYQDEYAEHQNMYNESVEKIDIKEVYSLKELGNLLNENKTNKSKGLQEEIRADLGKSIYFNECLFEMMEHLVKDTKFVTDIIEEEWQNKYEESTSIIEMRKYIHGLKLQIGKLKKSEIDYQVEDDDLDISDFQINEDGEIII